MKREQVETLEHLVDVHGVVEVLNAMADIAEMKAKHVETMWQDEGLVTWWKKHAEDIRHVADTMGTVSIRS